MSKNEELLKGVMKMINNMTNALVEYKKSEENFEESELCVDLNKAFYYEADGRLHVIIEEPYAIDFVKDTCNGNCSECRGCR